MNYFEITAEPRGDVGKGASRRLRRSGKVPGIVYGADREVTPITLQQEDMLHKVEHEAFYSHILTLRLGKDSEKVVLKDLQRHPFKRQLLHVDLQRISENEALVMRIPLHFINEGKCVGIKESGGVASHIVSDVEIRCLPSNLPEFIEIDMTEVKLGETIHLSDLRLPEGVENYALTHGADPSQPIVTVHLPRVEVEEKEEEIAEEGALAAAPAAAPADEDKQDSDDS